MPCEGYKNKRSLQDTSTASRYGITWKSSRFHREPAAKKDDFAILLFLLAMVFDELFNLWKLLPV